MKFTVTPPPNVAGQAKLILESNGLRTIQPKFFKVNEAQMEKEQEKVEKYSPEAYTWMGTPIFDSFVINSGQNYKDLNGTVIKIEDSFRFETCLITINQEKKIVTTSIAGADGTVKEYFGLDDYSITINGLIVGRTANQPIDMNYLSRLREVLVAPIPLSVSSMFLDFLNINSVVIKSFNFGQLEGKRNAMTVNIECIADNPFEIEYSESKDVVTNTKSVPSIIF